MNIEQIARKKSSYNLHMITSEIGILSFLKYIQIKSSSPWTRKVWQNNVRIVNSYIIINRMVLKCFLHKMQILMKKKKNDFCKNCLLDLGFLIVISVCVVIRGMNLQFSANKKQKNMRMHFFNFTCVFWSSIEHYRYRFRTRYKRNTIPGPRKDRRTW